MDTVLGTGLAGLPKDQGLGPLKRRYGMPPFSTWDTRQEDWQQRRQLWLRRGIKSELGRADALTYSIPDTLADGSKASKVATQTSVFDPVVCELAYQWWCPPGGVVLDPFAGGSVRGVVASLLGRRYWGCELRAEQVAANRNQYLGNAALQGPYRPKWQEADSLVAFGPGAAVAVPPGDLVFSCPPYGNLEQYSTDPADISTLAYQDFLCPYRAIIAGACAYLQQDRFAVWVVANFRDKQTGLMHDFVGDTVRAFEAAGLRYYNDIILINSVGSGAMRGKRTFNGARKVIKLHQNVLVFVKGCPKAATALLPLGKD